MAGAKKHWKFQTWNFNLGISKIKGAGRKKVQIEMLLLAKLIHYYPLTHFMKITCIKDLMKIFTTKLCIY